MHKFNILVVEDEFIVSKFICKVLDSKNYNVTGVASSGEDAVKQAALIRPDAILMDIVLAGDMDGIEAAGLIRKELDIPIIYLTSYADEKKLERAKITTPFGYILKPFNEKELLATLTMAIHNNGIEKKLKANEDKFRKLVQYSSDIVLILDEHFHLVYESASAEVILGGDSELRKASNLFELIHPHDKEELLEKLRSVKHEGERREINFRFRSSRKEWISLEAVFTNWLSHENINGIVVNARDVSARREAELKLKRTISELQYSKELLEIQSRELKKLNEKLFESEKKLIELNLNKDKFFSIIAHDLRSPFNSLLGLSEFLTNELDEFSEEDVRTFAESIHKSAKQVYALLENLLQWARIQSGRIEIQPSKLNLFDIANDVLDIFISNALKKNINLVNKLNKNIYVFADQNIITSVLQNLISNAIKFTSKGEIKISSTEIDDQVTLEVEDSGIGMDRDAVKKLFRIDVAYTTPGTENEKGTGLGLILSKELIEKSGGKIEVESEKGKGSIFRLKLPKFNTVRNSTNIMTELKLSELE